MDKFQEIALQLDARTLSLELSDCVVKRCSDGVVEEYRGTGSLEQDDEGNLQFSMEAHHGFDSLIDLLDGGTKLVSGKIIPLSAQYVVTGIDEQGDLWESSAALIGASLDIFSETGVVKLKPKTWKIRLEADEGLCQKKWLISGKLRGFSFGKTGVFKVEDHFDVDSWKLESNQATDVHLLSYSCHASDELEGRSEILKKGLSVLCGHPLQSYINSISSDGVEVIRISKIYHGLDRNKLYPFIDPRGGEKYHYLAFIRCWMGTPKRFLEQLKTWENYTGSAAKKGSFVSPLEDIFQHFYRIQFAFNADMENAVQVLSSAAEGLVNAHCKSFMDGDLTIIEPIAAARSSLESIACELDDRVVKIIDGALSRATDATSKAVFARLAEQGIISDRLEKGWGKARHSPAHGVLLNHGDEKKTQDHIDGFFKCYEIFKRLVFCLIDYHGRHTNIDLPEWPTELWPPQVCDEQTSA